MDKEPHRLIGNKEFENSVTKLRDTKMFSQTTNGCLEKETNRRGAKLEFAAAKSSNKSERVMAQGRPRDRRTEGEPNFLLKTEASSQRDVHGRQEQARGKDLQDRGGATRNTKERR
jgi:hypothetical protein